LSHQDFYFGILEALDIFVYPAPGREPGNVLGIATGYGLDGRMIESRLGQDIPHLSRPALGPTQPPVKRVLGLPEGKERPGPDADPSPPSSAVVKKEYFYLYSP